MGQGGVGSAKNVLALSHIGTANSSFCNLSCKHSHCLLHDRNRLGGLAWGEIITIVSHELYSYHANTGTAFGKLGAKVGHVGPILSLC